MSALKELIEKSRNGDQRSLNKLLSDLSALSKRVASKYKAKDSQDHDDLAQEALLAAHKAVFKYDLEYDEHFLDQRFYAYVRKSMEHAVICYLQQFDVVPVPRRLWQIRNIIESERPTDVKAFCERHNISESRFYSAKGLIVDMSTRPRTVDIDSLHLDFELSDELVEDCIQNDKVRAIIKKQLDENGKYFEERDLSVFKSMFFGHKTPQEVAEEHGICPSRVRYIITQTLKNMRELLLDIGLDPDDVI